MGDVRTEIDRLTNDTRIRLAMRIGALLEGGSFSSPWPAGDSNQSFGPYQIHLPAHPTVTREKAEDARFATEYMLPRYADAVKGVPAELWKTDPAMAAATAAYHAERPAYFYPEPRIRSAWQNFTEGQRMATTEPGDGGGVDCSNPANWWRPECFIDNTPLGDVGRGIVGALPGDAIDASKKMAESIAALGNALTDSRTWWRIAFIGTGVILVLAGFIVYARPQIGVNAGPVGASN